MQSKMTGAAGLAGAFVAGMVVATALVGGMAAAGPKTQGQQVTVQRVMSPTVTDADIALLRQDIRAMKMQVIGQNMSLSDTEAQKFWPIYKHYADDLHEVNNAKYELFKQYAETWETMTDQDRQESGTRVTQTSGSIRLFSSRLHSGTRVAFWNFKECGIGLCSRDSSDCQRGRSLSWISMLDHQIDAEILRIPIFIGSSDFFGVVFIGNSLGLSNSVRRYTFDLAKSEVFLFRELIRRSIAIGGGETDRRWLG